MLDGPFAGPYSRRLFPFFDEILRALSPYGPCRYVTLMSSAQCGKTTLAGIFALGSITLGRGAFLVAHPTEDGARRWSRMKLSPLMRSTAIVRDAFPQRSRDSADAVFFKERKDGLACLLITGANSPASLSQVTITNQVQDGLGKWELNSAGDPGKAGRAPLPTQKSLKFRPPSSRPDAELRRAFWTEARSILTCLARIAGSCRS
jgi:phage terminase large subunit GpA-like protein